MVNLKIQNSKEKNVLERVLSIIDFMPSAC